MWNKVTTLFCFIPSAVLVGSAGASGNLTKVYREHYEVQSYQQEQFHLPIYTGIKPLLDRIHGNEPEELVIGFTRDSDDVGGIYANVIKDFCQRKNIPLTIISFNHEGESAELQSFDKNGIIQKAVYPEGDACEGLRA